MLDFYCERVGPGLLAEPINASTNLAYLLAALAAWLGARRFGGRSEGVGVLIVLAVSVGIGSTLFHTFATHWANVLDLVPILLFQLAFLGLYLRRIVGVSPAGTAAAVVVYMLVCVGMRAVPPYLNGSILYAPTWIVLLGLATVHVRTRQPGRWLLMASVVVFSFALLFRSIDEVVCPYVPFGTHFLWHLLTGLLLYLAMQTLIVKERSIAVSS